MAAVNGLPRSTSRGAARVLLVDGDESERVCVARALRAGGYETREEGSAAAAELALVDFQPELIVLEAALPDADGFRLARRLTDEQPGAHVIFLTSRDATEDKVAGLALADDYLTKPVNVLELMARMRAILRRIPANETVLRFPGLLMNTKTHEVESRGRPVELTRKEFDLLRLFLLNPGRVLSKQEILEQVWREAPEALPGAVETYVSYLRRKLDASVIQTVRLAGYVLREPPSAEFTKR